MFLRQRMRTCSGLASRLVDRATLRLRQEPRRGPQCRLLRLRVPQRVLHRRRRARLPRGTARQCMASAVGLGGRERSAARRGRARSPTTTIASVFDQVSIVIVSIVHSPKNRWILRQTQFECIPCLHGFWSVVISIRAALDRLRSGIQSTLFIFIVLNQDHLSEPLH